MIKSSHNKKNNRNKKQYPLTPVPNSKCNYNNDINGKNKNKNESKLKVNKKSKFDFEKISIEEIENDFIKLKERKTRSEEYNEEKEILYLLRNSTKDNSIDENFKESKKIKRPKKPFLENFP